MLFSSHNMTKLAVPGRLGVLVTVFALNSKCQPWLVRHAPQHVPAWEPSCCILCMVRLDQDCPAEGPWCNQGAAKLNVRHSGSQNVSQSP